MLHRRDAVERRADGEAGMLRRLAMERGLTTPAPPTDPAQEARDDALLAHILASTSDTPSADDGSDRRDRRWALAGVAAAAVAALGVAVHVLQPVTPASGGTTPTMLDYQVAPESVATGGAPPAREMLLHLAEVAESAQQPAAIGEVHYVESSGWFTSTAVDDDHRETVIVPTVRRTWVRADGAFMLSEWRSRPLDVHGLLVATPDWVDIAPVTESFPPGSTDGTPPSAFALDPATLRVQLLEPAAGIDCESMPAVAAECIVLAIRAVYADRAVPQDLAGALWRVLADESAVYVMGETSDRLGRDVVAIGTEPVPTLPYARVTVLLVDRATGLLVGVEEIDLNNPDVGVTEPTVVTFTAYTDRRLVTELGSVE